ncbi:CPBP family intramembrane glutamic endopeptidase [Morganella morganii]|uniref:CPBP family intramembrane glutamic endopeptidase n=1 Tax=Morganella morganii TaxID=582 RepID=UPI001BDB3527|nr:CPBP family intramembrane glutamic endopeptidase [Morganella morganii]MBT0381530.1 CPBP family intramembrane metalloprotease [Morganella morganii subsp. morganii]MCU6356103.1 CPBP family intramembrane metalloprotease [Morganella morganii]HDU8609237.1 CPBP family intramembrane metalloprotease [Morganella morganii]
MTWLLLALSLLLLQFHRTLSLATLLAATISALFTGVMDWHALLTLWFAILLAVARPYTAPRSWQRVLLTLLVITVVLGLAFHLLPGFHNLRWMPPEAAGPHSPPYSFWFNADKALLPFVLIIIIPQLFVTAPLRRATRLHWLLLAFSVPALLLLATALGGLGFEPHLPRWLPAFMLANLFFVSLAEEALFRGAIQQVLSRYLPPYAALFIAAAVFGLAHIAGGPLLVVFAGLAGVIYGLAWMWSGRLWVATGFHFALNLCHLLFFTWPFKVA